MQPKYFYSKETAEEYFYKEVSKDPKYIGLFYNRYLIRYEVVFNAPVITQHLDTIKIHGTI